MTTGARARPLVILGAGKLGMTMGRLFAASSHLAPVALISRTAATLPAAACFTGLVLETGTAMGQIAPLPENCVVLLATADRDIATAAADVAPHVRKGDIVFHCSGALDSDVLHPCREAGASVASAHPMTTFADPATLVEHFAGVFCAIEGDGVASTFLAAAFASIGARVVALDSRGKSAYHAGAVLASGYLLTIVEAALKALAAAGISREQSIEMLQPLIETSLHNAMKTDPKTAMSGPLVRGDDLVTKAHVDALQAADPALARLYAEMTRYAAHVLGRTDPLGS